MPRKLRELVGLTKADDTARQDGRSVSRWRRYRAEANSQQGGTLALEPASGFSESASTSALQVEAKDIPHSSETSLPVKGTQASETEGESANVSTNQSLVEGKKSYWELAAKKLELDDPSVFEAFQELRKEMSCPAEGTPSEMSKIIEKHRNTMEDRQWSLPFKVRGREVKIRKQLESVWKVLQVFKDLGSSLASLDPIHAGIPWAGVNFILQGALNDSSQNAAAMDGLVQIFPTVARYAQVELIYLQGEDLCLNKDFETCLVDLYESILKYQVAAACHCKRSTFTRFLRALPKLDDWSSMLQTINMKDVACKELANAFDSRDQAKRNRQLLSIFQEQDKKLANTLGAVQEMERKATRAENSRILTWISDYIPGRDHQDILINKKMGNEYSGAGQWLFDSTDFLRWRSEPNELFAILWISGSVGTGKTSLVSRVIEWHLQRSNSEDLDPVAYFYCSRQRQGKPSGTDAAVILEGLIRQLAWSTDGSSIAPPIQSFYKQWQYERPDNARLSLEECSELLVQLVSSYQSTTIVIDALDECDSPHEVLRCFKDISESIVTRIRLFISSRKDVNVSSLLPKCIEINIEAMKTNTDMESFLRKEVKYGKRRLLKGKAPELEDRLIETLKARAQGMFRWVELQLAIFLDERTPFRLAEDVESRLASLDSEVGLSDLVSVYNEIYDRNTRAGTRDRENAIKLFSILLCAFDTLHADALVVAIALRADGTRDSNIDKTYLTEISSNFLVIARGGSLQFAHLSVTEYLRGRTFGDVFSNMEAHARTATICLTYVMHCGPAALENEAQKFRGEDNSLLDEYLDEEIRREDSSLLDEYLDEEIRREGSSLLDEYFNEEIPEGFDKYRLHHYACSFCLQHCAMVSPARRQDRLLRELFSAFLSIVDVSPAFLWWLEQVREMKHETLVSRNIAQLEGSCSKDPFFALCAYGFTENLRDTLLVRKLNLETRNDRGSPGLCVAGEFGHTSTVELLLKEGASLELVDDEGQTALCHAVGSCHYDATLLLLRSGANPNVKFRGGTSVLHSAIHTGGSVEECEVLSLVALLVEFGAIIDAKDDIDFQTPLHLACKSQLPLVVKLLLDHGASCGVKSRQNRTALHFGVLGGSIVVVKLLSEQVSIMDMVAKDKCDQSVLSMSLEQRSPEILTFLVKRIDLEEVHKLGNDEAGEFAEVFQLLSNIEKDILEWMWSIPCTVARRRMTQASLIQYLRAISGYLSGSGTEFSIKS